MDRGALTGNRTIGGGADVGAVELDGAGALYRPALECLRTDHVSISPAARALIESRGVSPCRIIDGLDRIRACVEMPDGRRLELDSGLYRLVT